MSIKTILAMVFALLVGIGGASAYFYFQRIDNALNAPPVPPARITEIPKNETPNVPAADTKNPPVQKVAPVAKGSLKEEDLVLGGISYGASIEAVRAAHGEPHKIENKHKWHGNTPVAVYDYANLFDLYVVDNVVRCIKVEDLNGLGTNKNIVVGSTMEDVIAAYGEPNFRDKDKIVYHLENNPSLGIMFEMDISFVEEIKVGVLK